MITIVPDGGLCNRMRAVSAARILAQRVERPLRVVWWRTPNCNARFDAIFETRHVPFQVEEKWAMAGIVRKMMRLRETVGERTGQVVLRGAAATPDGFEQDKIEALARTRNVYIRSFAKFLSKPDMFSFFKPVASIQRHLDAMRNELEGAVGVHIRRTDNVKAIEKSPMSAFHKLMDAELSNREGTRFFVATDSPEAYAELKQKYGDRVFEFSKQTVSRADPSGISDAVVDLYALGACQKIIGSYWSSFTDTAAELRNIERLIASA